MRPLPRVELHVDPSLSRSPPIKPNTQNQYSSNWSEPTQPKNKIRAFLCGFLFCVSRRNTLLQKTDLLLKPSRFRAGFIFIVIDYSDDYYYDSIDSHHFSENAQVQIVRVSRRPLPSTPKYPALDTLTPEYARFLAP